MEFSIKFNPEKNIFLKESRKVSFEDVIWAILNNKIISNIPHFNEKRYENQYILLVEINNYVYLVPYVIDKVKKELFLKTIYPSNKFTKLNNKQNAKKTNKNKK